MKLKLELLSSQLAKMMRENIEALDIDADQVADSAALSALDEIKSVINEGLSDFDIVHRIVNILQKYNIDTGVCHNPFCFLDKDARESEKVIEEYVKRQRSISL